ncbi:NADH:ubiquinone oxidoreductase ESSS subunit [Trinorchestia longiramus]|nr:NADH:ubiquinone oxidoreductase ESSS subunit [Trinorchestia longiramus]
MASLTRTVSRALALQNLSRRPLITRIACISTSKKDKDTSAATPTLFEDGLPEKFDARVTNKHWVSWGWDIEDRVVDATYIHCFFFLLVSVALIGGSYFMAYSPTKNFRDWAQREAYLEIRRREAAGLPHIDRDAVPVEQIVLPSEEELGNMEIVI